MTKGKGKKGHTNLQEAAPDGIGWQYAKSDLREILNP